MYVMNNDLDFLEKRTVVPSLTAAVVIAAIITWVYSIKKEVIRVELLGEVFITCMATCFILFIVGFILSDQYKHTHN